MRLPSTLAAFLVVLVVAGCSPLGSLADLTGMLDNPIHGPVTPFTNEPSWLWFNEADDSFLMAGWAFAIHFPPGVDTSALIATTS